jgi:hypothetical protein
MVGSRAGSIDFPVLGEPIIRTKGHCQRLGAFVHIQAKPTSVCRTEAG